MKQVEWYVYFLMTENGKIYTGISPDVETRFEMHLSGRGALFTKLNKPIKVLAYKSFPTKRDAAKLEIQIKKIPKQSKLDLIRIWNQT